VGLFKKISKGVSAAASKVSSGFNRLGDSETLADPSQLASRQIAAFRNVGVGGVTAIGDVTRTTVQEAGSILSTVQQTPGLASIISTAIPGVGGLFGGGGGGSGGAMEQPQAPFTAPQKDYTLWYIIGGIALLGGAAFFLLRKKG
jgi:LPXTG-motif cell wall-anchored protein